MGFRHELEQEKIRNEELTTENRKLRDQLTSAENLLNKAEQELKTYKSAFQQIKNSGSLIECSEEYIYILKNPAFPKYLKIGITTWHPKEKVKKLNSETAIPEPFQILFFAKCRQSQRIETKLQVALNEYRFKSKRDFFEIELDKALNKLSLILDKEMDASILNV